MNRIREAWVAVLSLLLHVANSSPPWSITSQRKIFFNIKEEILRRYGLFQYYETQHIKKDCWTCGGTGIFECDYKKPEPCWHCKKGIYEEFWVILTKWKLGKRCFHTPNKRYFRSDFPSGQMPPSTGGYPIEGYIRHRFYPYHLSAECFYWLVLLWRPRLFLGVFGHINYLHGKYTPMVFLSSVIARCRILAWHLKFKSTTIKRRLLCLLSGSSEDLW